MNKILIIAAMVMAGISLQAQEIRSSLKVATFNVSMEAQNYVDRNYRGKLSEEIVIKELSSGTNEQMQNIAAIIQNVAPDIILLNEFDYIADPTQGVELFLKNYLQKGQRGEKQIEYPYYFYSTVNTGEPSPYDLDRDGKASGTGNDAWGFGLFPGQYGMILLSKYPILADQVRTFQHFKWKDMPDHLQVKQANGENWYDKKAWNEFPLSSKSHWDVPVIVNGKVIHVLASHPTPPVFDGDENKNGIRNHDEIRFWVDYINAGKEGYMYDDQGGKGGLESGVPFIILGDLNASADEGDGMKEGISALLNHPEIQDPKPVSTGGAAHTPNNPLGAYHTAGWRMRADYTLPSKKGFVIEKSGVFWPTKNEPFGDVVNSRGASSDHRMVWVELRMEQN